MSVEGMGANKAERTTSQSFSGEGCDRGVIITAPSEHNIRINKWRVREGVPVGISQVVLLYDVLLPADAEPDKIVRKLKSNYAGVVKKRIFKEGDSVNKGDALLELSECVHTTVIKDMCADCGADLRQNENGSTSEASVPMVHSVPDLKVTEKLAQKLGHDDTLRLLSDRKLVLLVDLDQTLIHTTNDNVPNNIKGICHFQLYGSQSPWYHTRLRPGTVHFLERMSALYELHICTFGARNYAHMIAQLLDADGKFFSHRILSRDECFNSTSKTDNLKALFPNGDSMVCIIDDREDVWNMASNLIQVTPYHFFQHTGDINAPPGLSKHELDGEGVDFKELNSLAVSQENEKKPDNVESTESMTCLDDDCDDNETFIDEVVIKDEVPTKDEKERAKSISISIENLTSKTKCVKVEEGSTSENKTNPKESKNENTTSEAVSEDKTSNISSAVQLQQSSPDPQKEIEIEDPDDYLYFLEIILTNVHNRFYTIYDETKEIPDLKIIVPKLRSEVLLKMNLVFSGLVPTNMKLEQSRAYFIAKSLGANVSPNLRSDTTHLVAVTTGTFKVNAAKKNPQIKIVNPNWLWSCAERWERVEEKLFPLDRSNSKNKYRQPPAHCHSPEHVVNYSEKSEISSSSNAQQLNASVSEKFIDTINPLLSFSNADLADMNKEFDSFFESDTSSDDEHVNIENPPVDKSLRKRKREEKEEDRTREFFTRKTAFQLDEMVHNCSDSSNNEDNDDNDDELHITKFKRGEELSDVEQSSRDSVNNPDSEDDGAWNMMGAALEREFLGLED